LRRAGSMLEEAIAQQQMETASEVGNAPASSARKIRRPASQALAKLSDSLLETSLQDLDE
jgi:hypothetical protein